MEKENVQVTEEAVAGRNQANTPLGILPVNDQESSNRAKIWVCGLFCGNYSRSYDIGSNLPPIQQLDLRQTQRQQNVAKSKDASPSNASFETSEKWNIFIHIVALMCFKFGLENMKGCFNANLNYRFDFDWDTKEEKKQPDTFVNLAIFSSMYYLGQIIGLPIPGFLIERYRTKPVLCSAAGALVVIVVLILAVETAHGGGIKPAGIEFKKFDMYFARYNTFALLPLWLLAGINWGVVDIGRRVIPTNIVGADEQKLRKMDSLVHIFYEIAGTVANLCNAFVFIPKMGSNYAFMLSPFAFFAAAVIWRFLKLDDQNVEPVHIFEVQRLDTNNKKKCLLRYYFEHVWVVIKLWSQSIFFGGKKIFTNRGFIWLLPGFSLALYGHRYLEDQLVKKIAARYFGRNEWSEIIISGANGGEMLGALFVFVFNNLVKTPLLWLRLDALTILVVWYFGFWYPPMHQITPVWIMAGSLVPVCMGWAAGDVSINAYIQAQLKGQKNPEKRHGIDDTSSVMGVLNLFYVLTYAILAPSVGTYFDRAYKKDNRTPGVNVHNAVTNIAGVQFTILGAIIFAATFIPIVSTGPWWNPTALGRPEAGTPADEEDGTSTENQKQSPSQAQHNTLWMTETEVQTSRSVVHSVVIPGMMASEIITASSSQHTTANSSISDRPGSINEAKLDPRAS